MFIATFGFMFTHELDAVRRHEWRIMPLINRLSDEAGFAVFVLSHIPLFGLLSWLLFGAHNDLMSPSRQVFSGFCVVHVLLHWLFRNHPANEFDNPFSQFLIWGCGMAGAIYLLLVLI